MGRVESLKRENEKRELEKELLRIQNEVSKIKNKLTSSKPLSLSSEERKFYIKRFKEKLRELRKEEKEKKKLFKELKSAPRSRIPFISGLLKRSKAEELLLPFVVALIMIRLLGVDELIDRSFNIFPAVFVWLSGHQPPDEALRVLLIFDYVVPELILTYVIAKILKMLLYKLSIKQLRLIQFSAFGFFIVMLFLTAWGG